MVARRACALLLCALACARHDDDFAFDTPDEFRAEISNKSDGEGLRRLWGIPDTTAYVGRLFRMEITHEAFSGDVAAYKVRSADGRRLPGWLALDSRHGILSGVPLAHDLGSHQLLVTAHDHKHVATDTFTVEVRRTSPRARSSCAGGRLTLQLLLDARLHELPAKRRTRALMNLAAFMALDGEELLMESFKPGQSMNRTVLQSGPGSQRGAGQAVTAVYLDVGCNGKLWPRHKVLVAGAREQARDGTLAHVLELPLVGWRLLAGKNAPARPRRQLNNDFGSGDYDDEGDDVGDDYGSGDDYGEDDFGTPDDHPNIHNHLYPESGNRNYVSAGSNIFNTSAPPPPSVTRESPIHIVPVPPTTTTERLPEIVASSDPSTTQRVSEVPEVTARTAVPPTTPSTTVTTTVVPPTTVPTTTISTTTVPTTEAVEQTTAELTKQEYPTTTERQSTVIEGKTTEIVELPVLTPTTPPPPTPPPNQPPRQHETIKKQRVTAGRAFRFMIPDRLFEDHEDGTNLTYSLLDGEGAPLKYDSWIGFIPDRKEVYGLPLERHVSSWNFTVRATDGAGGSARAPLDVVVQHLKQQRTLNHVFYVTLKLQQKYAYALDWQIDALEGIVNVFRSGHDHIIVREADPSGDLLRFSWSNDTLSTSECDAEDIERMMAVLESKTDKGSPSAALIREMLPSLKVSSVGWEGAGACARAPPPAPAPRRGKWPVPRNQVDQVVATTGHLLVFKVPEDTFFDEEDGDTRRLHLSLMRGDLSPLPTSHWLQFDHKNQEFYGLPTERDVGTKQYQLIAEDSSGNTAKDALEVTVRAAPAAHAPVEFQMTMNYDYAHLAGSALAKRAFLESLAALFGDRDASAVRVKSITDKPTTVVWYNSSLPGDRCPSERIEALKRLIIKEEPGSGDSLTDRVDQFLHKQNVMSIRLVPRGACFKADPAPKSRTPPVTGSTEKVPHSDQHDLKDYLITFIIPAVVVVCMIIVAAIIACALYRRRKTRKMSVDDEEERQAFRSKGIPVIFQDELEDRPEPGDKSPVIMKQEKPPLLPPPDYTQGESPTPSHHTPYRPPPPFTASHAAARPKATPTYRKPPPYVPP